MRPEVERLMGLLLQDSQRLRELSGLLLLRAIADRERGELIREKYCLY